MSQLCSRSKCAKGENRYRLDSWESVPFKSSRNRVASNKIGENRAANTLTCEIAFREQRMSLSVEAALLN